MNNSISIFISGIEVRGEITYRSRHDLRVRITNPYYGLETGLHIPLFAASANDFLSDYGEEKACLLLKKLYLILSDIMSCKQIIMERYLQYESQKTINQIRIAQLTDRKKEIKKTFKAGLITQKESFFSTRDVIREIRSLDSETNELFQNHVLSCLPYNGYDVISIDIETQLMERLPLWLE